MKEEKVETDDLKLGRSSPGLAGRRVNAPPPLAGGGKRGAHHTCLPSSSLLRAWPALPGPGVRRCTCQCCADGPRTPSGTLAKYPSLITT